VAGASTTGDAMLRRASRAGFALGLSSFGCLPERRPSNGTKIRRRRVNSSEDCLARIRGIVPRLRVGLPAPTAPGIGSSRMEAGRFRLDPRALGIGIRMDRIARSVRPASGDLHDDDVEETKIEAIGIRAESQRRAGPKTRRRRAVRTSSPQTVLPCENGMVDVEGEPRGGHASMCEAAAIFSAPGSWAVASPIRTTKDDVGSAMIESVAFVAAMNSVTRPEPCRAFRRRAQNQLAALERQAATSFLFYGSF